jgi:hypothetical protein
MMQVILLEFVAYPQHLHALIAMLCGSRWRHNRPFARRWKKKTASASLCMTPVDHVDDE